MICPKVGDTCSWGFFRLILLLLTDDRVCALILSFYT